MRKVRTLAWVLALMVPALAQAMPVGVNLDFFWGFEWASTDIFKYARPFREFDFARPVSWEERNFPLEVTADGYPRALRPGTEAQTLIGGRPPEGRYRVTWEGQGDLLFASGARELSRGAGTAVIDVRYHDLTSWEHLIQITIRRPDRSDPIRNIRIVPEELAHTASVFHPLFLERLAPFGVIRFLNWMHTNQGPPQVRWASRSQLNQFGWGELGTDGVPLEFMVALSNETGASPWFTIHHTADDDYIRRAATLIRDTLDPGIPVYFEWSNEVWNGIFPQNSWAIARGEAMGFRPRPGTGPHEVGWQYTAARSVQMFKILEEVFGAAAMGSRVIRVLPGWVVADPNALIAATVVDGVPAWRRADVFAMAPYFAHFNQNNRELLSLSPERVIQRMRDREMPESISWIRQTREALDAIGATALPLVAYEAGQHLADYTAQWQDTPLGDLYVAVNRHEMMRDLYREYLQELEGSGMALVNLYRFLGPYSGYGSFGLLERQDQPVDTAPKYAGTLDYLGR